MNRKKDFSVNKKGHIRFGLGGLKGVGEAAVESLIEEREKNGPYQSIFDMIKRVNQRTVNKKTLESLVYAGGFDCFTDMHRAQYFFIPPNDTSTGLEKIVRFGNVYQAQNVNTSNTAFWRTYRSNGNTAAQNSTMRAMVAYRVTEL